MLTIRQPQRNQNGGRRRRGGGSQLVLARPSQVVVAPTRGNRVVVAQSTGPVRPPGQGLSRSARRRRGASNGTSRVSNFAMASAYGQVTSLGGRPNYRTSPMGGIIISHKEVVSTVLGSTAFSSYEMFVIPQAFTWVSGLAQNFSRYRWLRIRYEFVTNSPTSQAGTVAMGAVYDHDDRPPETLAEVQALAHSWMGPVWSPPGSVLGGVEIDCSRMNNMWYPYKNPFEAADSSNVPALIRIGIETQVNGQIVGHVVAHYELELIDPIPRRMNENNNEALLLHNVPPPALPGSSIEERLTSTLELLTTIALEDKTRKLGNPDNPGTKPGGSARDNAESG